MTHIIPRSGISLRPRRYCCGQDRCSRNIRPLLAGGRCHPDFRPGARSIPLVRRAPFSGMRRIHCARALLFLAWLVRASALWFAQPETGAAWGSFGAIFTAIAVAHTLYAPREVVLWNWRRIALLGLSLALAVGSQFSLIVVVPLALAFMLYLAPTRRVAASYLGGGLRNRLLLLSRPTFSTPALSGRACAMPRSSASRGGLSPCLGPITRCSRNWDKAAPPWRCRPLSR